MKHHIRFTIAALASAAATIAAAQDTGAQLARETLDLVSTQDYMLVTAVRQKVSRGGAADFQKFILGPVEKLSGRWAALPAGVRVRFIPCVTALQEHENHVRDSFKAGAVGKPSTLRGDSVKECGAAIAPTAKSK